MCRCGHFLEMSKNGPWDWITRDERIVEVALKAYREQVECDPDTERVHIRRALKAALEAIAPPCSYCLAGKGLQKDGFPLQCVPHNCDDMRNGCEPLGATPIKPKKNHLCAKCGVNPRPRPDKCKYCDDCLRVMGYLE